VVIVPNKEATETISEAFRHTGTEVKTADMRKLNAGGETEINEAEKLISYLNNAKNGIVFAAADELLSGKFGVELRRGGMNLDLVFNGGNPLSESHRRILERNGAAVEDFFGETEYPQSGGPKKSVGESDGFELPFEAQINLVYHSNSGGVSYEGTGRFAYLPFGLEGQATPGIYISGVECKIKNVSGRQLLYGVERVTDPDRGCYRE
jgi:hypothetical protein